MLQVQPHLPLITIDYRKAQKKSKLLLLRILNDSTYTPFGLKGRNKMIDVFGHKPMQQVVSFKWL